MKIAILGYGKEGQDVANYWQNNDADITVFDRDAKIEKPAYAKASTGENYLKNNLIDFDYIFRSPGFYRYMPEIVYAEKKGVIITSQTKLFFKQFKGKIIAITGTNGKGTTATLIYEILKAAKKQVFISGNIGSTNLLEILDKSNKNSFAILELSSFQLIDLDKGPFVSVVTSITEDHLDWHKNFEEYINAKSQIVRHQSVNDYVILNINNKYTKNFSKITKAKIKYFSNKKQVDSNLLGIHNIENINAAIQVAKIFKIGKNIYKKAIGNYKAMPHRLEFVKKINDIDFYNDSCSTSDTPTIAAIKSFDEQITLILGGSDKGLEFNELAKAISKSSVVNIILIGQTASKIKKVLLKNNYKHAIYEIENSNMKKIVKKAFDITEKGIILLSPASASFGDFENYKDRGEQFKKQVKLLK